MIKSLFKYIITVELPYTVTEGTVNNDRYLEVPVIQR